MAKVNYNKKTKILSIRLSDKQSVDSDVQGNVVVDYDKEGKIVNIEIMNINFEEFSKTKDRLTELLKIREEAAV